MSWIAIAAVIGAIGVGVVVWMYFGRSDRDE